MAFFTWPPFYKHPRQKIENFQLWTKYLRKTHFQTPFPPSIQCCSKEWKFAKLIHTEVVHTHKQHWKWGRGGFSQNILSRIIDISGLGETIYRTSKVYDCLPHDLLIARLEAYGLDKPSLNLVNDYLFLKTKDKNWLFVYFKGRNLREDKNSGNLANKLSRMAKYF